MHVIISFMLNNGTYAQVGMNNRWPIKDSRITTVQGIHNRVHSIVTQYHRRHIGNPWRAECYKTGKIITEGVVCD